jgi:hypothetical protein
MIKINVKKSNVKYLRMEEVVSRGALLMIQNTMHNPEKNYIGLGSYITP